MQIAKLKNLTCKRGNTYILKEINWKIQSGENWIIWGNNGSGKTTLASILAGYSGFSDGILELFGECVSGSNVIQLRKNVGFCSSSYFDNCFTWENGINIVMGGFLGQLCGQNEVEARFSVRGKQIFEALGLKYKGFYPYDSLSKGQREKVLLARALLPGTLMLVLDEPCSGLDLVSREYVLNTLSEIAKEKPVVYVTHNIDEIKDFFTHAILLKDGKIHSSGMIRHVFSEENLSDYYGTQMCVCWTREGLSIKNREYRKMSRVLWGEEI